MQITLFCKTKNIQFNVSDEQGSLFIQSCRDLLITEGSSPNEIALMDDNRIVYEAVGSMDYNNEKKARRNDRSVKIFSLNARYTSYDEDNELPVRPSAEDEFLATNELERVKSTVFRLLPSCQAEVFFLHAIEGMTFDKIGEKLGKKPDTCAHAYYDAVKNLKKNESDIKIDLFPWTTI